MPCYRCGARQVDPARGPSPWKRGVRGGVQVLICPECQQAHNWTDDMDRCRSCGSTSLVRALGETRCKACGATVAEPGGSVSLPDSGGLSDEVASAVARVLGRYPGAEGGS